jgi:hypothetical protein
VLCLLALSVAALAWPGTRWVGDAADLASPLRLLGPALHNTIVILSGYLAAAALGWGLADATMAQPHDLERFDALPDGPAWRVAHLSDLHIVGGRYEFRLESGRSGPRGNDRVRRTLSALAAADAERPVDVVLITGDMTDAGRSTEWAEFVDALSAHPNLLGRTLILPGNHDLNVVDRANPARLDLPGSPSKHLREIRMLSAIDALQGDRVHVLAPAGGLGETLSRTLDPHRRAIQAFAETGSSGSFRGLKSLWRNAFPLVLPPATADGLGVVLLDSNAETHFSFTNALGLVTAQQARRLRRLWRAWPEARWIVALHHHLVEYPQPAHAFSERIGTVLINGSWFVRQLEPIADRALVMHGHRHIDWIGQCGALRIVSAPSPVMSHGPAAATFRIHQLGRGEAGRLALGAPQEVTLAPEK